MPFYLRRLHDIAWWDKSRKDSCLYANCLRGLCERMRDNSLSFWLVDEDICDVALAQIVKDWSKETQVHYAKVDPEAMEAPGLLLTPVDEGVLVSESLRGTHRNLEVGTADRLLELAKRILEMAVLDAKTPTQLGQAVRRAASAGLLDEKKCTGKFIRSLLDRAPT